MAQMVPQPVNRSAGELFRRVTEHPFDRWARVDDAFLRQHQQNAVSAFLDHGPKEVLTALQHVRGPLAFGHVHHRVNILSQVTGIGKDRARHAVQVPYRSIRKNNSILELITRLFAPGLDAHFQKRRKILGMNTLSQYAAVAHFDKHSVRRLVLTTIKTKDSEQFRRSKCISRGNIVYITAHVTESLGLLQIDLA